MDLKSLEKMTVPKLREEALKIPDLSGVRGMSKDELVRAIATAHGVDLSTRQRGGGTTSELKRLIHELRESIRSAIAEKDSTRVKRLRRSVRRLKAKTRHLAATGKAAATGAPAAS
jgi:hypothetical protein